MAGSRKSYPRNGAEIVNAQIGAPVVSLPVLLAPLPFWFYRLRANPV